MAIIDNRVTAEGDVLIIKTEAPVLGLIALTQFVDTTANESETDYFLKEFRVSENGGLTFGDWIELTLSNIQSVVVSKFDAFVIEYRYTRVGNAPLVELEFQDILVSGVIEDLPYPAYQKSIFSKFFTVNDINIFGWALNVLEKIYVKGLILPNFYERGLNQSNLEDEDFIVYWNSITHFFALIVYFARQFHNFDSNEILLLEFLKSKDISLPIDENITDLLLIYENYVNEFKKRGTLQIIDQKETGAVVDGELIRLIDHKITEEFLFALFQNFESGWCIGKSSPTWNGTENIVNLIKGYEFTDLVADLSKYPLVGETSIEINSNKLLLNAPVGECGIKYSGDDSFKIIVDPDVDYEISFRIKQTSKLSNLSFGCLFWDIVGNSLSGKNIETNLDTVWFFENQSLHLTNQDYWIRGILFHKNKSNSISKTNIGFGRNIIMPPTVNYIVPTITVDGDGDQDTYIDRIKIRPVKLNFTRGQLGVRNLIYLFTKNNNHGFSDMQINQKISQKLIPYNSFLKSNFIITEQMSD